MVFALKNKKLNNKSIAYYVSILEKQVLYVTIDIMNNIILKPIKDKRTFIKDIQKAFKESYEISCGSCKEQIISVEEIEESFAKPNSQGFYALIDDKIAGGVVVIIDKTTRKNSLDLLYVNSAFQSRGIGLKIWLNIEKMYPETKVWETYTPYFDKRNIHFYVNKCGFHIVEFFNPKHKNPNIINNSIGGMSKEVGQYFFRFEKILFN